MPASTLQAAPQTLTYEDYMAEGEVFKRYDILDGIRLVTNPNRRHQRIQLKIAEALHRFEHVSGLGQVVLAPADILIRRQPLRTRQPDVLFISHAQLAKCGDDRDPAPLVAAPELVVEILSPSDRKRVLDGKLADYRAVGVQECWVVDADAETVEVLRISAQDVNTAAMVAVGETAHSLTFPGLMVPLADIFSP